MKGKLGKMSGIWGLAGLSVLLLSGCQNLFEGGVIFGGPTILAERRDFRSGYDALSGTYTYTYTLAVYALPGSGSGMVVFLDEGDTPLDSLLIPQACGPDNRNPCGPFTKEVSLESPSPLAPKRAVKYRSVSANGQSKVIALQTPLELYKPPE